MRIKVGVLVIAVVLVLLPVLILNDLPQGLPEAANGIFLSSPVVTFARHIFVHDSHYVIDGNPILNFDSTNYLVYRHLVIFAALQPDLLLVSLLSQNLLLVLIGALVVGQPRPGRTCVDDKAHFLPLTAHLHLGFEEVPQ